MPTEVISNGVPADFRPVPKGGTPDFGDRFVLLSVGRLAREKRHELVIDAVRHSRHRDRIQLVILGDGPFARSSSRRAVTCPSNRSSTSWARKS
jgi:glycosyltransferase involved in cell wall biosynthesis